MNSSCIRSAVLMAAFACIAAPGAVAQEAEPARTRGVAAARVLRLVDDPSVALERALSADSLQRPGGLWHAAALLQAELTGEEKQRIIAAVSRRGQTWQGKRRPAVRNSRGRNQRHESGRLRREEARRHRHQVNRSRAFRDRARPREAMHEAWEALKDSALTVQERRQAIAEAVREAAAAERQAAIQRASAEQHARDAALGIDGEARAAMEAELEALRARFDSLRQQADTARRTLRAFRAESAGTEAYTPAQREAIQLHAALGRLLRSGPPRGLSRKR